MKSQVEASFLSLHYTMVDFLSCFVRGFGCQHWGKRFMFKMDVLAVSSTFRVGRSLTLHAPNIFIVTGGSATFTQHTGVSYFDRFPNVIINLFFSLPSVPMSET